MCFGSIPFLTSVFIPNRWALIGVCVGVTLFLLAVCGAIGAYFGGASMWRGTSRLLLCYYLFLFFVSIILIKLFLFLTRLLINQVLHV